MKAIFSLLGFFVGLLFIVVLKIMPLGEEFIGYTMGGLVMFSIMTLNSHIEKKQKQTTLDIEC